MRVIIAGGRDFNNYFMLKEKVLRKLSRIPDEDIVVVYGEARGADALGKKLAEELNWQVASYPADWTRYGKSAGYKRNELMAEHADALIAFWDGKSKGTKHMIDLATRKGLLVQVYSYS